MSKFLVLKRKKEWLGEAKRLLKYLRKNYPIGKKNWCLDRNWYYVKDPKKYSKEYKEIVRGRGAWDIQTNMQTGKKRNWRKVYTIYLYISYDPNRPGLVNEILNDPKVLNYHRNSNLELEIFWNSISLGKYFSSMLPNDKFVLDSGYHAPIYDCDPKKTIAVDPHTDIGLRHAYIHCWYRPEKILKRIKDSLKKTKFKNPEILINYSLNTKGLGAILRRF